MYFLCMSGFFPLNLFLRFIHGVACISTPVNLSISLFLFFVFFKFYLFKWYLQSSLGLKFTALRSGVTHSSQEPARHPHFSLDEHLGLLWIRLLMNILTHYFCRHIHSFLLCKYLNEIAESWDRTLEVSDFDGVIQRQGFWHLKICIKQL